MKTKTAILSIAIIAALPFTANAENISGNMYTAPATYDTNHPAPTTNATPPFGRVNIDTDDQEHIATTAYVKGAYNSAIAAVNEVDNNKVDYELFDNSIANMSDRIDLLETADGEFGVQIQDLGSAISAVEESIADKRVDIYTTWDTDATTQVELSDVRPAQGNN